MLGVEMTGEAKLHRQKQITISIKADRICRVEEFDVSAATMIKWATPETPQMRESLAYLPRESQIKHTHLRHLFVSLRTCKMTGYCSTPSSPLVLHPRALSNSHLSERTPGSPSTKLGIERFIPKVIHPEKLPRLRKKQSSSNLDLWDDRPCSGQRTENFSHSFYFLGNRSEEISRVREASEFLLHSL